MAPADPEEERDRPAAEFVDRSAPDGVRDHLRLRVYDDSTLEERPRGALVARELVPGVREAVAVDHPDSARLVEWSFLEGTEVSHHDVFRIARDNSIAEPFDVSTHEARSAVPLLHLGGRHRYVTAHLHVLGRYLDPTTCTRGALVVFPVPEVVLAHVLGTAHPILAMEVLQELAAEFVKGDTPITSQVYWWRPRAYEHVGAEETPRSGHMPHLVPVGVDVDHEARTISVRAGDDFRQALDELLG